MRIFTDLDPTGLMSSPEEHHAGFTTVLRCHATRPTAQIIRQRLRSETSSRYTWACSPFSLPQIFIPHPVAWLVCIWDHTVRFILSHYSIFTRKSIHSIQTMPVLQPITLPEPVETPPLPLQRRSARASREAARVLEAIVTSEYTLRSFHDFNKLTPYRRAIPEPAPPIPPAELLAR
jgi:hypothetical protein